jgi:hypothetical protein
MIADTAGHHLDRKETAAEVEDLVVDSFDGIREILLARGLMTVHR